MAQTESELRALDQNDPHDNREGKQRGIKFFRGGPLPSPDQIVPAVNSVTTADLRTATETTKNVWRPEETVEAARILFTKGRLNVTGGPQWGKGTILFGMSEVCSRLGWGFVFFDGHRQETSPGIVVDKLIEAETRGIPVLYDSFDYLFANARSPRGIRTITTEKLYGDEKIPAEDKLELVRERVGTKMRRFQQTVADVGMTQAEYIDYSSTGVYNRKIEEVRRVPLFTDKEALQLGKAAIVIGAIEQLTVPVAITSHTDDWAHQFLNADFRAQFQQNLDRYPTYDIPLNLQSPESIKQFLLDNNMPQRHADFITNLGSRDTASRYVINTLTNHYGDKNKVDEVVDAVKNYPVLKDLTRPYEEEVVVKGREVDGYVTEPTTKRLYKGGIVEEVAPLLDNITAFLDAPASDRLNELLAKRDIVALAELVRSSNHRRIHLATLRRTT